MLETMIAALSAWIVAAISAGGYAGVALLMAIESACVPLPSELIMPFAGYLVSTGRFTLIGAATAGAIGCNIGSAVAYEAGYFGGRAFILRWGRYVLLQPHDLDLAERLFTRYGAIMVLAGRMMPVIRTFIALPAGIGEMPRLKFHLYTFIGSWPWCFGLAYVGRELGQRWNSDPALKTLFHRFDAVIVAVVVLAVIGFVWHRRRRID
jgi:membrane protein DedA with SNARE-associated domain